jgi:uncharacterized protein
MATGPMGVTLNSVDTRPWYREPWPWLLMAGPFAVVVAGIATMVIAFESADGVVADDYYKRGLAINRELARDDRAAALGLSATATYDATSHTVVINLRRGDAHAVLPAEPLRLHIVHPARSSSDEQIELVATADAEWSGRIAAPLDLPGRFILLGNGWRLAGRGLLTREPIALRPAALD